MKVRVLQRKNKQFVIAEFDSASLVSEMAVLGFAPNGKFGRALADYPHLEGCEKFDGLDGPMPDVEKDGTPMLRYEDWETSNLLST